MTWQEDIIEDLKKLNLDLSKSKFNEKAWIDEMGDFKSYTCPLYLGVLCKDYDPHLGVEKRTKTLCCNCKKDTRVGLRGRWGCKVPENNDFYWKWEPFVKTKLRRFE